MVTNWDPFGYYLYLPAIFIYDDYTQLDWLPEKDEQYRLVGGWLYQAGKADNGNYVGNYLAGVALMQSPFFAMAHLVAPIFGYPQDGFSAPYQFGVIFAALFYAALGIFILRKVLLRYFDDVTTAIAILLMCMATNFIQYAAVDSGMCHIYIFPLYSLILLASARWHEHPTAKWAAIVGGTIGLATVCRPTEALMLFIPIFWQTQNREAARRKWQLVKQNKSHIYIAATAGMFFVAIQMTYWKITAGTLLYNIGSAWDFLTPHLRVLTGWEKGWFIYTPITLFFIAGMFFIKKYEFRKSVLWFCLLNIYLIISWRQWHYAASYSARALVQSYPVFTLPFAAFIHHLRHKWWRQAFYGLGIYLVGVNIFQLGQYASTVLHYMDMNRKYYAAIYLDKDPTPLDMSLLDNDELMPDTTGFSKPQRYELPADTAIHIHSGQQAILFQQQLSPTAYKKQWLQLKADITIIDGYWEGYLNMALQKGDSAKYAKARLCSPISTAGEMNSYELHMQVPEYFSGGKLKIYLDRKKDAGMSGNIQHMWLTAWRR